LNVLPAGQLGAGSVNTLMLSITSGRAPDVALGVEYKSPVEFAFRDAVVDLTQFADYKEVEERFYPSIMIPYAHDGGIFALPETMDFTVLFYRKDIVKELGLRLPNTWEDVYQEILPKLYENSMNFCYSQLNSLPPLLFQHGGNFYKNGGTMSGLDSAEAYQAFKQWTELYTNYGIPAEANFFTRMRNGDMPMGVANYALYVQMSTSAPELYGRWDIAPIPGTVRKDGTVDRSVGSIAAQAGVIMEQSTHKEEAWEFLKWWTSEETQTRYGRELEALLGVEARWNTANKNAFENLPWDKNHLSVIKNQLDEAKEQPIVLGGYFTTRHIENAWNRVVLGNENVRDSLEQAVKDINKELRSKQEEYGYITEE
ncbi:MAG: extracellular solute-binding protein, partial [Epulopiscium sp.]|nr:extracellular solute-binding protein [Candidatus Epulonipiscium sp.]